MKILNRTDIHGFQVISRTVAELPRNGSVSRFKGLPHKMLLTPAWEIWK
jgi:hypothetical protein